MNDDLEQPLLSLHLKTVAKHFDEQLAAAEADGTPVPQLLTQLLRAEWQARQQHALVTRIQRANIPEQRTLESFPFKIQTGVNQRQIRTFAELEFIPRAENIVFVGETRVGKTGLASALLLKAMQNGYRGLFIRALRLRTISHDGSHLSTKDR